MRVVAFLAIVCGCLFIGGFLMADRVRITVHPIKGRPDIDVIITVPHVTGADTLFLEACSAEMSEDGVMFCMDEGWYMNSAHPMRDDQRQYPFPLRNVPRGWLMLSAAVVARNGQTLASGETRLVR